MLITYLAYLKGWPEEMKILKTAHELKKLHTPSLVCFPTKEPKKVKIFVEFKR